MSETPLYLVAYVNCSGHLTAYKLLKSLADAEVITRIANEESPSLPHSIYSLTPVAEAGAL